MLYQVWHSPMDWGDFIIRDQKLQDVSMAAIKTVVVTAVLTEAIKYAAGRARPYTGEGAGSFHPFPGNREPYKSFPSGHTSLAFAVFTPFAEGYSRWIYAIPMAVGAGRVMQDKHWVSDVAFGGGIGFLAGYFFYHTGKRVVPIPNGLVLYF
jgi:membrane-associated phospholipid phosphatase